MKNILENTLTFAQEKIEDVIDEAKPLLLKHWEEIATFKDISLDPDYELYFKMERMGLVKGFSARDENGKMAGYSVYFIKTNPHYKNTLFAVSDVLFIQKENRGRTGYFLIKYCEEELKKMGVDIITYHIKATHNWGRMIERMGYGLQDLIYLKRMD